MRSRCLGCVTMGMRFAAVIINLKLSRRQARESATSLKINPDSISIGGISAGGQISCILQHMARDTGVPLKLCLATVPVTSEGFLYKEYTESPFGSFHEFAHGPVLPWSRMKFFGELCFPRDDLKEICAQWPDWWTVPLQAKNWTGLCDTFIRTGECDVLRDEGEAYAAKVVEGGNKVTVKRYLGAPHIFMVRLKHATLSLTIGEDC